MPEADASEVERRAAAFAEETGASGEIGLTLARNAALNSVRMERAADRQTAALTEHVRRAEAEFVAPEGVDSESADRLRAEACRRAMFDPSKEAALARKYEAAAERSFFRALKELRQMERAARAEAGADAGLRAQALLGSMRKIEEEGRKIDAKLEAMEAKLGPPPLTPARRPTMSPHLLSSGAAFDVPITIGRPR